MFSFRKQEDKAKQPATKELLQRRKKQIQIPLFYGEFDPNTYLEWEKDVDFVFHCHRYKAEKQVQLASTGLCGYALDWWYQTANTRRQYGEEQISSWYEMKDVMKKRFVSKRYGQTDLERMQSQAKEAKGHVRTSREKPKSYYGHEVQRKFQPHEAYLDELQSPQFKEHLKNMIDQSLTDVMKKAQDRSVPLPTSRADELGCYKKEPAEEKGKIAAKPAVKIPEIEPALVKREHSAIQLQQEEHVAGALCGLIHDHNKAKEEGELDEALVVHKESLETLIEQGGSIRSFSCDLLIQPCLCVQFNFVEHLRFSKGLQQVVFEPGGSLCVHLSINNNLVQTVATLKLDLERLLHGQREPMLVSGLSKLRSRGKKSKIKAYVWYQWREAQSETVRSELNKEQKLLALSVACNQHTSVKHLGSVKALQGFVFEPGGDIYVHKGFDNTLVQRETKKLRLDSLFIHEVLDLRTNPFKGRGNGVTWISFKYMFWKPMHVPERQWAISKPNGFTGELIGLIHEVLDREKAMGLAESFMELVMTWYNNGRPVWILIDQEMDGSKLVRQEMKWVIWYDPEMGCSNRHEREISWKWKMKNLSWKWNIRIFFINKMSLWRCLARPGTRLKEPKQEMFEKGLYRPKKWKDKPAWIIIGPRRLGTSNMFYFKFIYDFIKCKPIRIKFGDL